MELSIYGTSHKPTVPFLTRSKALRSGLLRHAKLGTNSHGIPTCSYSPEGRRGEYK